MLHFDGNPFYQVERSASSEYAPSMTFHQDSLICQASRLTSIDSWDEEATGKVLHKLRQGSTSFLVCCQTPLPRAHHVSDFHDLRAFEWFSLSSSPL